ncbi:hypothetical protein LCGC14_2629660, partial [marine sediment metagenome]
MADIILTKEKLYDKRVKNGYGITSGYYYGNMKSQYDTTDPVKNSKGVKQESIVTSAGGLWKNSQAEAKLWNEIEDLRKKVKNQLKRLVNIN